MIKNFIMGLLNETDNTYQQGLTSLLPINYEINVTYDTSSGTFTNAYQTPKIMFIILFIYFNTLSTKRDVPLLASEIMT